MMLSLIFLIFIPNLISCDKTSIKDDLQTSTITNFKVHPEIETKSKFQFMPHFDQSNYNFMIPEGANNEETSVAMVQFYGLLTKPTPEFSLIDDDKGWFKIGSIETVKETNYMITTIGIYLKKNVEIIYKNINQGIYEFKIVAKSEDDTAQANVKVEILSFAPLPAVSTTSPANGTSTSSGFGLEENVLDIKATTLETSDISDTDGETSTISVIDEENMSTTTIQTNSSMDNDSIEELKLDLMLESFDTTTDDVGEELTTAQSETVEEVDKSSAAITNFPEFKHEDAFVQMPPMLLQIVEKKTQLPVDTISMNHVNDLENYEIRTVLNQSVMLEMIELTIEPDDVFEIRPRFVLNRMGSQIRIKNSDKLPAESNIMITAKYADVDSDQKTTIPLLIKNGIQNIQKPIFKDEKYVFQIPENSQSKTIIGAISAMDPVTGDDSKLIYSLIGSGSELFLIDSGNIILMCPENNVTCLDHEKQTTYYLITVVTTMSGISSDPVTIVINILDQNDNSPRLKYPDKIIQISDGRIVEPFNIQILDKDTDDVNSNSLIFEGSASKFLEPVKISSTSCMISIADAPEIGGYLLDVIAQDDNNPDMKSKRVTIKVEVLNVSNKSKFNQKRYERKIKADKLTKGSPLTQVQFHGQPVETIRFIFMDNDDALWLTIDDFSGNIYVNDIPKKGVISGKYSTIIGAIDRQTNRVIDKCEFDLIIEGNQQSSTIFNKKIYSFSINNVDESFNFNPLIGKNKIYNIIDDSIYAYDYESSAVNIVLSDLKINNDNIIIPSKILKKIKGLQFQLVSSNNPNDRALVTIYTETDISAYNNREMMRSKPKFTSPWVNSDDVISIKLPEEAPLGHHVLHISAYNPETGEDINNIVLEGDLADHFVYDSYKKSVLINKLIDYETIPTKNIGLKLIANNNLTETIANINVVIQNLNDNPPEILLTNGEKILKPLSLTLNENASPGKPLIELMIHDSDVEARNSLYEYDVRLLGEGSNNFQINKNKNIITLSTSPVVDIDYETKNEYLLLLQINDTASNIDSIVITINILDENDNRPIIDISRKNLNIVENWPSGAIVGIISASDKDTESYKDIDYTLSGPASKFLSVNQTTGELITSKSLTGLASFEPYPFSVHVNDHGFNNFTTTGDYEVRVLDSSALLKGNTDELRFVTPSNDFVLTVSENIPVNTRLITAEVKSDDDTHRNIHYSIEPVSSEDEVWLSINPTNGDVYVQNLLDYETTPFISVYLIASDVNNLDKNISRLFRINIQDVDDNGPVFVVKSDENGMITFVHDDTKDETSLPISIGKLYAIDKDSEPFNMIYYYLLSCSTDDLNNYEINEETGELLLVEKLTNSTSESTLCVLASPVNHMKKENLDSIEFDERNSSMTRVLIRKLSIMMDQEMHNTPVIHMKNNTVYDVDSVPDNVILPFNPTEDELNAQFLYKIDDIQFKPLTKFDDKLIDNDRKYDNYIFIDPNTGNIRFDPEIVETPEGIYTIAIKIFDKKNGHFIGYIDKTVNRINKSRKLKFIFDKDLDSVGLRMDQFKKQFDEILNTKEAGIQSIFSDYNNINKGRSSVCFYLAYSDDIVGYNETIKLTSTEMNMNNDFMKLYQEFNVINIEDCVMNDDDITSAGLTQVPQRLLLWISVIIIGLIIFFALICYTCFIARYRDHLQQKSNKLKEEAKLHFHDPFSIPQFIDPKKF